MLLKLTVGPPLDLSRFPLHVSTDKRNSPICWGVFSRRRRRLVDDDERQRNGHDQCHWYDEGCHRESSSLSRIRYPSRSYCRPSLGGLCCRQGNYLDPAQALVQRESHLQVAVAVVIFSFCSPSESNNTPTLDNASSAASLTTMA